MERYIQLVRQAKRGDVDAFAALYQGIYQDMYRFALYSLGNTADAQDVVGDAVADAFASVGRLRSEEAFRGWMFRILSNKCKRRLAEYRHRDSELTEELLQQTAVDDSMADRAEHMRVRELFLELASEDRLILSMHIFAGYTTREIAKQLQMNENTVRSRESRALKRLREKLQEY